MSSNRLVGLALWCLLFVSGCWAAYSAYWLLWLARVVPPVGPSNSGWSALLAEIQGYGVVFGPTALTGALIALRTFAGRRRAPPPRNHPYP